MYGIERAEPTSLKLEKFDTDGLYIVLQCQMAQLLLRCINAAGKDDGMANYRQLFKQIKSSVKKVKAILSKPENSHKMGEAETTRGFN